MSVRDIATAADVNLSAINYYFGSRANLLVTILRTRTRELASERQSLIEQSQRALPDYSREEICWRFHVMMSIGHMNAYDAERLQILSAGICRADDQDEVLERAVSFALAGFLSLPRAAAPRPRRS